MGIDTDFFRHRPGTLELALDEPGRSSPGHTFYGIYLLDLRQEIRNVILEQSSKLRLNFAPLCLQACRLFHFKRYSLTGLNASGLFKVYLSIAIQDKAV